METKYFSTNPESWDKSLSGDSGITEFTYKEEVLENHLPDGIDIETLDKVLDYLKEIKEDGVKAGTEVSKDFFKSNEEEKEAIVNFKYGRAENDKISMYVHKSQEVKDENNETIQTSVIKIKDYNSSLLVSEEVRKTCTKYLFDSLL